MIFREASLDSVTKKFRVAKLCVKDAFIVEVSNQYCLVVAKFSPAVRIP